jgi:hypothetical protein
VPATAGVAIDVPQKDTQEQAEALRADETEVAGAVRSGSRRPSPAGPRLDEPYMFSDELPFWEPPTVIEFLAFE